LRCFVENIRENKPDRDKDECKSPDRANQNERSEMKQKKLGKQQKNSGAPNAGQDFKSKGAHDASNPTEENKSFEGKQRRGSLSNLINQMQKLYGTKDKVARMSLEDFLEDVKFHYSIPWIVIDFIDYMTGEELTK